MGLEILVCSLCSAESLDGEGMRGSVQVDGEKVGWEGAGGSGVGNGWKGRKGGAMDTCVMWVTGLGENISVLDKQMVGKAEEACLLSLVCR